MSHNTHQTKHVCLFFDNAGVTLVELMITVAISGFVIAAIYMSFRAQQEAATTQNFVASMQQNLRAASHMISTELRMAGYDPTKNSDAGFISANASSVHFAMDLDEDGNATGTGESNENITYSLYNDSDGIPCIGRKAPTNNRCVAEYIANLTFSYFDEDNTTTTTLDDIRSVRFSITAFSRDDPALQRQLVTSVHCRNMGL